MEDDEGKDDEGKDNGEPIEVFGVHRLARTQQQPNIFGEW